jgi:hypothetical protein
MQDCILSLSLTRPRSSPNVGWPLIDHALLLFAPASGLRVAGALESRVFGVIARMLADRHALHSAGKLHS